MDNAGSTTRYGSNDLLDFYKILNNKVVSTRKPQISNPWRWNSYQELKQIAAASVPTPSDSSVVHFFLDTDNKAKLKKTGGTVINLEDVGSGTWSNTSTETVQNKTFSVNLNTLNHSTTNNAGDILVNDGTKYGRLAKGTANQVLAVNAAGTTLEYQTPAGGGGGGEANTASNVGSDGIGFFYQKLGVDLQFKKLYSPDASINVSDDVSNNKVDITLAGTFVKTTQANTFGDFLQAFRSSKLSISNPANTFAYFFVGSAITASRNATLPLLGGNDQFTFDAHSTTLTNKTLGSGTVANTDTITLKHSTTNSAGELLVNTGTKFDRKAKGSANTYLRVNSGGTDLEFGALPGAGNLDSLTDVAITSPTNTQHLEYESSSGLWKNKTVTSGGTRETLAASFSGGHSDSIGTTYEDILAYQIDNTGGVIENSQNVVVQFDIDFTGFTQYKVTLCYTKDDSSAGDTHDIKVIDANNSSNFFEMLNVSNGTNTKSLASYAAWMTGVKRLKVQHKANATGNTPTLHNFSMYLK